MSTEKAFKDPRLLEALEYLDKKYIAEVFDDLKVPSASEKYISGNRKPFKHWRQFAALAACLLVLAFASPIVNYVVEAVRSFAAGWGDGTEESLRTEELTNDVTEEIKSNFVSDAELSESDLKILNRHLKGKYGTNEKLKNSSDVKSFTRLGDGFIYYGKVNGFLVYYLKDAAYGSAELFVSEKIDIDIYKFVYPVPAGVYINNGETILQIEDAYAQGLLSKLDIAKIHQAFYIKVDKNPDDYITENNTEGKATLPEETLTE